MSPNEDEEENGVKNYQYTGKHYYGIGFQYTRLRELKQQPKHIITITLVHTLND